MRQTFMDTMKDPDFLAGAKRTNLDRAILEQNVKEILKLEPALCRPA